MASRRRLCKLRRSAPTPGRAAPRRPKCALQRRRPARAARDSRPRGACSRRASSRAGRGRTRGSAWASLMVFVFFGLMATCGTAFVMVETVPAAGAVGRVCDPRVPRGGESSWRTTCATSRRTRRAGSGPSRCGIGDRRTRLLVLRVRGRGLRNSGARSGRVHRRRGDRRDPVIGARRVGPGDPPDGGRRRGQRSRPDRGPDGNGVDARGAGLDALGPRSRVRCDDGTGRPQPRVRLGPR